MERQRTHYSREFKIKAVELSNQRGSMTAVAEELNVAWDTLKRWKKEYNAGKFNANGVKVLSNEAQEIRRLQKELNEARLERDILKKAVSIFSKSDR